MRQRRAYFAVLVFLLIFGHTVSGFEGGDGSSESPYEIADCQDLQAVGSNLSADYRLVQDIDCSESKNWNNGRGFDSLGKLDCGVITCSFNGFRGVFEGNGHIISDLYINWSDTNKRQGLFGFVDDGGVVKNIGVVNSYLRSDSAASGLIVGLNGGDVRNSFVEGSVIYNGSNTDSAIGGAVGNNLNGSITGHSLRGSIKYSYSLALVKSDVDNTKGGFVGANQGPAASIYGAGYVTDDSGNSGGLIGLCGNSTNGYTAGEVDSSYWNINSSNLDTSGGDSCASSSVTGLSEDEFSGSSAKDRMKELDFKERWSTVTESEDGFNGYPILQNINIKAQKDAQRQPPGSGTSNDPYRISDCFDLQRIENDLGAYYMLINDVDCSEFDYSSVGNGSNRFTGVLDGQGYRVENLDISEGSSEYVGIIGYLDSGEIKNIGVVDANINGGQRVGALAGFTEGKGDISKSYSTGSVSASDASSSDIGGLIGQNDVSVSNSYSTANVSGEFNVGGLFGQNHGDVSSTYSSGNVSGNNNVGGLVGSNNGSFSSSYWDVDSSGVSSSAGGNGLTTSEMEGSACGMNGFSQEDWNFFSGEYPDLAVFSTGGLTQECNSPPSASFISSSPVLTGEDFGLDASESSDPDGDSLTYEWDTDEDGSFDDATGKNPSLSKDEVGSYSIGLKVSDGNGGADTSSGTVTVESRDLSASFTSETNVLTDEDLVLDASGSVDPDGGSLSYEWDFDGDGYYDDASGIAPKYNFSDDGSYEIGLRVENEEGDKDTTINKVTVENRNPSSSFSYSISDSNSSKNVSFDASYSDDSDGTISSFAWDWDEDGDYEDYGEMQNHIFESLDNKEVELRVEDDDGDFDTKIKKISSEIDTDITISNVSPEGIVETSSPQITAEFNSSNDIQEYALNLDGSNVVEETNVSGREGSGTYDASNLTDGEHYYAWTVKDASSNENFRKQNFTIRTNESPKAVFSVNGSEMADEDLVLDASGSVDPDGGSLSYEWDFDGDGYYDDASGIAPSIEGITRERYNISLKVVNKEGETDEISKKIIIGNGSQTSISYNPSQALVDESIELNALVSNEVNSYSLNYMWDTDNDGDYSDAEGRSITTSFAEAGEYVISVKIIANDNKIFILSDSLDVSYPSSNPEKSLKDTQNDSQREKGGDGSKNKSDIQEDTVNVNQERSWFPNAVILIGMLLIVVFTFIESYIPEEGDPLYDLFN